MTELEDAIHADIEWAQDSGAEDLGDWLDMLYEVDPSEFAIQVEAVGEDERLENATLHCTALIIALARFGPTSPHTLLQWVETILGVGERETERGGAPRRAGEEEIDPDCAYRHLQHAVRLLEGLYAPEACAMAWITLATWEPGKADAARLFRRAVDTAATDPDFPPFDPATLIAAAVAVASTGDLAWAKATYEQARKYATSTPGLLKECGHNLVLAEPNILFAGGSPAEAERAADKARQALRRRAGPWDPSTLQALQVQVLSLLQLSRASEAKRLLDPILAEHRKQKQAPIAAAGIIAQLLVETLRDLGRHEDAQALRNATVARLRSARGAWEREVFLSFLTDNERQELILAQVAVAERAELESLLPHGEE